MEEKIVLSDNGKKLLAYMQQKDITVVGKDVADELQMKGVYPVFKSLISKGLIEHGEPVKRDFTNAKGVTRPREYKTYQLTQKGKVFNIN